MNPFASNTVGIVDVDAVDGHAYAHLLADRRHLNSAGAVHGGVMATLVDTAMGAAVRSAIDDGDAAATTQLTLAHLRPGHQGEISVDAHVGKQGEHILVCQARIEQDGEALVEALATFAVTTH